MYENKALKRTHLRPHIGLFHNKTNMIDMWVLEAERRSPVQILYQWPWDSKRDKHGAPRPDSRGKWAGFLLSTPIVLLAQQHIKPAVSSHRLCLHFVVKQMCMETIEDLSPPKPSR